MAGSFTCMPMSETRLSGVKDVPLILWVDAVNGEVDWHPRSLFDSKYAKYKSSDYIMA